MMRFTQPTLQMACAALFACLSLNSSAAGTSIQHRLMFFEYGTGANRLVELDAAGRVVWEHIPPSIAVIFEVLPNGNVLYAYGGKPTGVRQVTRKGAHVFEVTRDKKVVWKWENHDLIKSLTTVRVVDR